MIVDDQQHTFVNIYASTHTVYTVCVDMCIHTSKYAQEDIFKNNTARKIQQHWNQSQPQSTKSAFKPQMTCCDFAAKLCP